MYLGLLGKATDFMLQFLKIAKYHIKTPHGISSSCFRNLTSDVYRVLQGSVSTPVIWLCVSAPLLKTYNRKFPTQGLSNPIDTEFIEKNTHSFVDYTNLWDILIQTTSIQILLHPFQQQSQYWETILFATSGKLNANKYYWYLLK